MSDIRPTNSPADKTQHVNVSASRTSIGFGDGLRKYARLVANWLTAAALSLILTVTTYTLFIGRDRAYYNEEIYENHFLINAPHSEQLYLWEGYGLTTYGENGLVVDKEIDFDIPRVLFLGDSYVEAKQVSDQYKFTELLEKSWNDAFLDQPMQALNLGAAGFDMRHYISFGSNLDRVFSPSLVFVMLNQQDFRPLINSPKLLARHQADPTLKLVKPERLNIVQKAISDSPFRQFFIRIQLQTVGFLNRKDRNDANEEVERPANNDNTLPTHDDLVATQLEELKDIWGDRLVIIYNPYIPALGQAEPSSNQDIVFVIEAQNQGIPLINLYEPMLESYLANQPPKGFQNTRLGSGHYNQAGHRMIANEILGYLESSNFMGVTQ